MIKFKTIRWKNFLSYGNSWTEIDLDATHTTILLGDSGSGKSTLLDALKFVCYNKPYRNITKPQLVNSVNGKDCVVELWLEVGNTEYQIIRGIKPNIFEIYKNGHLINQDASVRDYQIWLEQQVFGFNSRTFDQIVVLGAANFTPFMQLRPQDRRIIIEELLDIQIFGVMNLLLKEKMSGCKESLVTTDGDISLLDEKRKLHEKYIDDLVKNKEKKIQELEIKVASNRKIMDDTQILIDDLQKQIEFHRDKLKAEDVISKQAKKIKELEAKLSSNFKKLNKEIQFYEENDSCPTCKQSIDVDFKITEIQNKTKKASKIEDGLAEVDEKLSSINERQKEIDEVKAEITVLTNEIQKHQNNIGGIEKYYTDLQKELAALKRPKKNIMDERKHVSQMITEISALEAEKEKLLKNKAVYETASLLLKDTGVKSRIIKQYLPLINKYTNKFLSAMNFFASFYMNENFQEYIKSRGHDDFSYGNFSEGEKQRIDLALLFTWRTIAKMKNSVNTNLLVMDEIFDSYLDVEATENVIELLNSKMFSDTNIFVISHKNTISDKFERKLSFRKVKNFSRVEE